ncbi:DUF2071 domain-containing protein [Streptomyces sp. A3M-1-3]|uniref:DUF2071 domain-containing protein n=1 Tax=Streptomyces sp. A3M-1-3 TaxID=2962044 RepID=UPI0020B84385|nr:DUF2071 domain-containing protein [Streptomyces sp. A3M-1-3]MCP3818581.1 DUF2071 domain-containing protein [Streptomyces sp. A3M-1-3]
MIAPRLSGVIERRLLVNYRVEPGMAAALLPAPLRPQLVRGWAVGGICLLRLGDTRPRWAPGGTGLRSENAAHRIAVEWDGPAGVETGVYIPRRDSGSRINVLAGGRVFPGEHGAAVFDVQETPDEVRIEYETRDGATRVSAEARVVDELRGSVLFRGLDEASEFFRRGPKGFSATRTGLHLDGMELHADAWRVEATEIRSVRSSFFEDPDRFPPGSALLDSALLMRNVPVRWDPLPPLALVSAGYDVAVAS